MVRERLSEDLMRAGLDLLVATDALGLSAQGAMWVYSHLLQDWRYYLVSSLVDTMGRRKAYQLLIRAFEVGDFPQELTVEDVHLGSPEDPFFQQMAGLAHIENAIVEMKDCWFNGMQFDGVIYRAVKHAPAPQEARAIEKQFERKLKERERVRA